MKNWLKGIGFALLFVFLAACSTDAPGSSDSTEPKEEGDNNDVTIGFSVSTLNNPFFVTLANGTEAAAEEAGYKIITSDAQDDPSKQLNDIEDLLQQDIDVLIVNPVDSDAIVSAVQSANNSDIPVITVDRSSGGGDIIAHIASDNISGGEMAGEFIKEQLGEEANIVELEGIPGASATRDRGEGFHNIIDEIEGFEVVAKQTANFDRTEGLSVMENIIQGSEDIDAVFAHNDEMALGAVEALEAENMLGEIIVVGFDATDDAVEAVNEGRMNATVAQLPELLGEKSIEVAGKVASGETVEEFVPVELELVK